MVNASHWTGHLTLKCEIQTVSARNLKLSRIIVLILVIVVIGIIVLFAYEVFLVPSSSSPWLRAAAYPLQLNGEYAVGTQQCVNSTTYITCIGGTDANSAPRNEVFYAQLTPNITVWNQGSNSYPQNIDSQSCVASSGYVYCVGGQYDDNGDDLASSYFAPLDSNGSIGSWNQTSTYPIPVDTQSCVAWSSSIYCIGGYNETDGNYADSSLSNSVYHASLSSEGIGSWLESTAYPSSVYLPVCVASSGYVYCVGGSDSNGDPVTSVYYTSISSTGVGSWTATTEYPAALSGQSCVITMGYIYCVGGEASGNSYSNAVYYATISNNGIGSWKQAKNYADSAATDCVASSSDLYCVGGLDGSSLGENADVFYYPLASISG
jgi:N-acetylneuraminic acid mutarotase